MPRLVFPLLVLLALPGCGPRLEVARDRLLAEADRLLGEIEVHRKEIDPAIQQAEATLARLKKGRIEVQVRASQISHHLSSTHDRLAETDRALARLRDLLGQGSSVEIAGTAYTPTQLGGMATRAISTRKSLAVQAGTLQSTAERLQGVVALLETREQAGRDRLDSLKGLLVEIDAKAVALTAIKEAARVANAGAFDFEALERQIQDLEAKIDGELAFHEEMLRQTPTDSDSVASILRDTGSAEDMVAEIDKLLGKR